MFHKGASEATQVCATLHFRIKRVFDIPLPKPHGEGENRNDSLYRKVSPSNSHFWDQLAYLCIYACVYIYIYWG